MNPTRLRLIESQQTSIARKVLDATPISEYWTLPQIVGELSRNGIRLSMAVIEGCLDSMRGDGLLKENSSGQWKRVEIVDRAKPQPFRETDMPEEKNEDALDVLAKLATRLRTIADEIDAAAILAAQEVEKAKAGSEELRQLKALLKNALS